MIPDLDLLDTSLKDGRRLDLEFVWDSEGDLNRGFIAHRINAHVNGEMAGYLVISYIPQARFDAHYPEPFTALNYQAKMAGWGLGLMPFGSEGPKIIQDVPDLNRVLETATWMLYHREDKTIQEMSREEVWDRLVALDDELRSLKSKALLSFIEHNVDKPKVDFIRVLEAGDRYESIRGQVHHSKHDYRRLGIGTLLYKAGALWMAENGLALYASTMQQPEAQLAWEKMEAEGLPIQYVTSSHNIDFDTKEPLRRRYLDGDALRAQLSPARLHAPAIR